MCHSMEDSWFKTKQIKASNGTLKISETKSHLRVCLKMLCTPFYPMVLLIIIPFLNGYFIGNINPTFSDKPIWSLWQSNMACWNMGNSWEIPPIYAWCSQLETSIHSGFAITPHANADLHVRSYSDWEFRPLLCGAPWSSKCVPAKNEHQTNSPSSVQNLKCSPFKNCLVHRISIGYPQNWMWYFATYWIVLTTCNHQSTGFWTLLMAIIAGKKPEARWSTFNTYPLVI